MCHFSSLCIEHDSTYIAQMTQPKTALCKAISMGETSSSTLSDHFEHRETLYSNLESVFESPQDLHSYIQGPNEAIQMYPKALFTTKDSGLVLAHRH